MISKEWLLNKQYSQSVPEEHKFSSISKLSSIELFERFIEISNFKNIINNQIKTKDEINDFIKFNKEFAIKLQSLK